MEDAKDRKASEKSEVSFAWIGDLHLTTRDHPNFRSAGQAIDELNRVVKPDIVQFAGDNAQHGRPSEFDLFNRLRTRVKAKFVESLVGDHDVFHDPSAEHYRKAVNRKTWGATTIGRYRFVRLDTMDVPARSNAPHGMTRLQLDWLNDQFVRAASAGESVVLCQHHYPFKVFEQFDAPGIDRWREIVGKHRPIAIFCGHTHYGQIANDGRLVYVATRSLGDPEGGPGGYTIAHFDDGEFALRYRTVAEVGPILLIVSPRQALLATEAAHIVTDKLHVKVRCWTAEPLVGSVQARLNDEPWTDLDDEGDGVYAGDPSHELPKKGVNVLAVRATDKKGQAGWHAIKFIVDPTGRFTAVPGVDPVVDRTDFC